MNFRKFLCSLLTVTVTLMGMQGVFMTPALASTVNCTSASPQTLCSTVKVGANTVYFPKPQWTLLAADTTDALKAVLASSTQGLDQATVDGNDSVKLLGMSASQVPAAISSFPANVPIVIGRYESMNKLLRVDVFRIDHQMINGKLTNAVYQMTFSPAYGEMWKAKGTYLDPATRAQATTVGPDPFSAFNTAGSDSFSNISLSAAMVVVGHAQRYVGAPMSLLINYVPSYTQTTTKSGNIFKKKVTTTIDFYAQPEYYLGAPAGMQGGAAMTYCANDPTTTSCQPYQYASSGATFAKLDGGNLNLDKVFINQWSQSKSGFTLLTIVLGAALLGFGLDLIVPTLLAATSIGATTGIDSSLWSNLTNTTINNTSVAGMSSSSVAALASITSSALSTAAPVVGYETPQDPGADSARQYVAAMATNGTVTNTIENSIAPVKDQLVGSCGPSALLQNCSSTDAGVVPRADTYQTFDSLDFVRSNGSPIRASGL